MPATATGFRKFVLEKRGIKQQIFFTPSVRDKDGKMHDGAFKAYKAVAAGNPKMLEEWRAADYKGT